MVKKLNLGSYLFPLQGYWNVDILKWKGVDEEADLNKIPWPWKDGEWDHVRAVDIIEHLGKSTKVEIVQELARIIKPGGTAEVRVPCETHAWAWSSLQHAHGFNYNSFEESYAQPWFKIKQVWCDFRDGGRRYKINFVLRTLCKFGFVQCLTFELEKK